MLSEDILAAVIDFGSSSIRAGYSFYKITQFFQGFSGDGIPKFVYPSVMTFTKFINLFQYIKIEDGFETIEENKEIVEQQEEKMEVENQDEQTKQPEENQDQQNQINQKEQKKVSKYYLGEESLNVRKDFAKIAQLYRSGQCLFHQSIINLITDLDFDLLEQSLQIITSDKMKIQLTEIPLLMSETSLHNPKQRQKLCQLLFEKLNCKNMYFCKQAVLSCFASGRSNSLILDSGAASTIAVPVHDGYTLQKQIVKFDVGGDFLNKRIQQFIETNLQKTIHPYYSLRFSQENDNKTVNYLVHENTDETFEQFSKMQIVKDIKENNFKVSPNDEFPPEATSEKTSYEMPDGSQLTFAEERYSLCECFFNPIKDNNIKDLFSYKGLQYMATNSIDLTDIDLRKELYSNIIICGGNSLLSGFVERLQKKIFDNARVKLIAYPQSIERKFSTWLGGSILASLGSFQNLWVTKAEYDEHGSYIVEKKCP